MNAGLKRATGEIALCFDADYYPQRDIVEKLVREFVDLSVGAVQGRPVVWNEAQNAVTRLVRLERIGGYRVDQEARDNLGLIPQFGGTTWGFRRPRALRSKKLNVKEKIDGLLLLHAYFMPVLTLVAFVAGVSLIIAHSWQLVNALWLFMPVSFYSIVGNFAPFFEIGIGAYLDGRTRIQWLIPLLIFAYFYNILICTKALLDLLVAKILRRSQSDWAKTHHLGDGNSYIEN